MYDNANVRLIRDAAATLGIEGYTDLAEKLRQLADTMEGTVYSADKTFAARVGLLPPRRTRSELIGDDWAGL